MPLSPFQIGTVDDFHDEMDARAAAAAFTPALRRSRAAAQSVPHNAATTMVPTATSFDNDGLASGSGGAPTVTGLWRVSGQLTFTNAAGGVREGWVQINGVDQLFTPIPPTAGNPTFMRIEGVYVITAGHLVVIRARHNTTAVAPLNVFLEEFSMHLIAKSP